MASYGRNFDLRQSPDPAHRLGRWKNGDDVVPNGAPVIADGGDLDANGRRTYIVAPAATPRPLAGTGGFALYEQPDAEYTGLDPQLTRPSDMGIVPAGVAAQLCFGTECRLEFRNTEEDDFRGMRTGSLVYAARTMVAGASGATPTVVIDDLLGPGDGNDTDGWWQVVADPDDAWLVVTEVDTEIGLVVAQMLF